MEKLKQLKKKIEEKENLLVAFSGGVDSGFLLKVAHDVLGEKVLAVTLYRELFPKRELEEVKSFLNLTGILYKIAPFYPLRNDNFVRNPYNRCYYCKRDFAMLLKEIATEKAYQPSQKVLPLPILMNTDLALPHLKRKVYGILLLRLALQNTR